jgi:adenylate cyclase
MGGFFSRATILTAAILTWAGTANAAEPPVSLAVLPFANASGDMADEAFADGITDEIGATLGQILDLHVGARTSAFRFKGETDTAKIGKALSRNYLLQGSVRKADGRIRLSAKLVRAEDGAQLWTQDYYSNFADVFDMEEDIAKNVAQALKAPTGLGQGDRLVRDRTSNMEAYEKFLRAKPLIRARGGRAFADARLLLEQAVAADPNFVPALAMLAFDYDLTPLYAPVLRTGPAAEAKKLVDSVIPKAMELSQKAVQANPRKSEAYVALAYAEMVQGHLMRADIVFRQALALDPSNTDGMHGYSQLLAAMGQVKEAIRMRERLQALEPFVVNYVADTAEIIWLDPTYPMANETAIRMLNEFRPNRTMELAQAHASLGRFKEAASVLREMNPMNYPPGVLEGAAKTLESAPAKAADPANLPRLSILGWAYLYVGAPERTMEYYETNLAAGYFQPISTTWFWHPSYQELRKTARFKNFVRDIGLVEAWRRNGWPEFCRPLDSNEFTCD